MTTFGNKRSAAAKWMFDRKDPPKWWRWSVLTSRNPDPEALKLSDVEAGNIFADLVHDGFLIPIFSPDGDGYEAYSINLAKEVLWKKAISPTKWWWRRVGLKIGEWIVSGFIGALIGAALIYWLAPATV